MAVYDKNNPYSLTLVVGNRLGIHARPSMAIQEAALAFPGRVTYCKHGNEPVDATSILQVLMQCPAQGQTVHFKIFPDQEVSADSLALLRVIANLENVVCHDDDR